VEAVAGGGEIRSWRDLAGLDTDADISPASVDRARQLSVLAA
jgi:hypothetical protein